jgi:hypothetical protein
VGGCAPLRVRLGMPLRAPPPGIPAVVQDARSPDTPSRRGSVDVFLEASGRAEQGDVLVVGAFRRYLRRIGGAIEE